MVTDLFRNLQCAIKVALDVCRAFHQGFTDYELTFLKIIGAMALYFKNVGVSILTHFNNMAV